MPTNILNKLGLSEKEAKVYLSALELGPATVQAIAKKADITRTTAYGHIKSLIKKGLMNSNVRDRKTYFSAEPPENLFTLLDARKKEVAQLLFELQKTMPRLKLLFETTEERPRIKLFEGKEGLKSMVNDFMKSKFSSVEEFTPIDEAYEFSPPQKNDYRQKIKRKFSKVPMRTIYTSEKGSFLKPKEKFKERRFLPKDIFPFTGSITIYGNKVSLISQKRTISGVIIENKEIADTLRTMFNFAWETSEKYQTP